MSCSLQRSFFTLLALQLMAVLLQRKIACSCPLEEMLSVQTYCRGAASKCVCDFECCDELTCDANTCTGHSRFKPVTQMRLNSEVNNGTSWKIPNSAPVRLYAERHNYSRLITRN
ncbi:uncharacterized protein LOC144097587 isoform X2 [Amblyomma americanum]